MDGTEFALPLRVGGAPSIRISGDASSASWGGLGTGEELLRVWESLVSSSTAVWGVPGVDEAVAVGWGGDGVDDSLSAGDEEGTGASLLLLELPSSLLSICSKEEKIDDVEWMDIYFLKFLGYGAST